MPCWKHQFPSEVNQHWAKADCLEWCAQGLFWPLARWKNAVHVKRTKQCIQYPRVAAKSSNYYYGISLLRFM